MNARVLVRLVTGLVILTMLFSWSGVSSSVRADEGSDDGPEATETVADGGDAEVEQEEQDEPDGSDDDSGEGQSGDDDSGSDTSGNDGEGDSQEDDANSGGEDGSGSSEESEGGDDSSDDGSADDGDDSEEETGDDDDGGDDDGSDDNSGQGNADDDVVERFDDGDREDVPVVDDDADASTDGFRGGEAIVRLHHTADIDDVNARHGTTALASIPSRNVYLLRLPTDRPETVSQEELAADPDVAWSELNYANRAPEGRPGYFFVSGAPSPDPGPSYAADLLGLPQAESCATGAGITVAVLDTGVDVTHPALAGHLSPDAWNALTGDSDVADTGNGRDDDGDGLVDEMAAHGTHVAGIVMQTAPGTTILPIKVLDSDGVGDAFFLAAGIFYAVDHGAQVINLSLGSTFDARVVHDAVAVAVKAGVVVVAAAGNADRKRPREYPAADRGALGVAATDAQDHKSAFSNFGPGLALSAPGTDIVSAIPGGDYAAWSGTSMAAPFVAGAAAVVLAQHPGWTAAEVAVRLMVTASDLDVLNPEYAGELGAGRLNLAAAVECSA